MSKESCRLPFHVINARRLSDYPMLHGNVIDDMIHIEFQAFLYNTFGPITKRDSVITA